MSTLTAHRAPPATRLTFGGLLRSEWIKLFSLRSTLWCYAIIVVINIALGLLVAIAGQPSDGALSHEMQQSTALTAATLGISFGQLVSAVLGALTITGEYGTGMIRSTLTAVPKRTPALVAKVLVVGLTTFVVGLVSIAVTALITAPLLPAVGVHPDFGDSAYLLALVGAAAYLALIAMLALGIGGIIRNSAGGIATSLGLILVVPVVLNILAGLTHAEWVQNISTFLPSNAGSRMYTYVTDAVAQAPASGVITLEPWQGGLVLVAWVAVLFTMASVLLKRRDA
ncbi:ABC transporter permease subunit [Glaciihabitans sp. UYNi722]|uniref:ABC transporter permease subunit n=1 Tax=Glaciihabitans sp. UYNi722 TaxID=3156344 RepID=UPI0033986FD9